MDESARRLRRVRMSPQVMIQLLQGGLDTSHVIENALPTDAKFSGHSRKDVWMDPVFGDLIFFVQSEEFEVVHDHEEIPLHPDIMFRRAQPWEVSIESLLNAACVQYAAKFLTMPTSVEMSREFKERLEAQLSPKERLPGDDGPGDRPNLNVSEFKSALADDPIVITLNEQLVSGTAVMSSSETKESLSISMWGGSGE